MRRVRQDDQVQILAGKDRGQRGPVRRGQGLVNFGRPARIPKNNYFP